MISEEQKAQSFYDEQQKKGYSHEQIVEKGNHASVSYDTHIQTLITYISKKEKEGYSKQYIVSTLLQAHWPKSMIEKAYDVYLDALTERLVTHASPIYRFAQVQKKASRKLSKISDRLSNEKKRRFLSFAQRFNSRLTQTHFYTPENVELHSVSYVPHSFLRATEKLKEDSHIDSEEILEAPNQLSEQAVKIPQVTAQQTQNAANYLHSSTQDLQVFARALKEHQSTMPTGVVSSQSLDSSVQVEKKDADVEEQKEEKGTDFLDPLEEDEKDDQLASKTSEYKRPVAKKNSKEKEKKDSVLEELEELKKKAKESKGLEGESLKNKLEALEAKFSNIAHNRNENNTEYHNPLEVEEIHFADTPVGERAQTGLGELDRVIDGGFPRNSVVVVAGGAGTGKTSFALQFIVNGVVLHNEPGVYITFEQSRESIFAMGKQFGWDLENLEKQNMLIIHEYSPEQIQKAVTSGGGSIRDLVDSIRAKRFVIDSITEYVAMFSSASMQRRELNDLFRSIAKWGCTSIVIGEEDSNSRSHASSILDYEADGVILLYNERRGDVRQRSIEIFKMRGTRHTGRIFPMRITQSGVKIKIV